MYYIYGSSINDGNGRGYEYLLIFQDDGNLVDEGSSKKWNDDCPIN